MRRPDRGVLVLLTDATVDRARATLERLHSTTATLSRLTETTSASGSVSNAWTTVGDIACRVETDMGDTSSNRVRGVQPADRPVYEYTVFTAHDADVRLGDRLTLASGIVLTVMQASRGQSQGFVAAFDCSEVS